MSELDLIETIHVSTADGMKEIQLWQGDITKLPMTNKVDIVMVSAYPGSYDPVRGSLIASLADAFGVSVSSLARKKAEDLRMHLHCWLSKDLPNHLPYKKLMCFEPNRRNPVSVHEAKSQMVGGLFRALFALIDQTNQDFSVITPLLGTGSQRMDKTLMMQSMLRSCIYWMRAGLPLRRILFVIYRQSKQVKLSPDDAEALEEFRRIKTITETENAMVKPPLLARDALIVYAQADELVVQEFVQNLNSQNENVIVNKQSVESVLVESDNYEDAMQSSMMQSKHVLVALSPHLMQISEGIELYNMALCLSRRSGRQMLIPLYVASIDQLPTYMTLIQWIDLRLKDRDLPNANKILQAAEAYLKLLLDNAVAARVPPSTPPTSKSNQLGKFLQEKRREEEFQFDLFLSYSHRDTDPAKVILSTLRGKNPNLKIFFDKEGIKTGHSWQATVLESVSRSRIVIALLSPFYFASSVCCEEFNLALSLHVTQPGNVCLIPLCLYAWQPDNPPIQKVPLGAHYLPLLSFQDAAPHSNYYSALANFISDKIGRGDVAELLQQDPFTALRVSEAWRLKSVLNNCRKDFFQQHWQISASGGITSRRKSEIPKTPSESDPPGQLAIVFHDADSTAAEFMKKSLQDAWHDAVPVHLINCPGCENAVSVLDKMETVLLLLTTVFVHSAVTMDVMQVCLSLRRSRRPEKFHLCPVILSSLPADPLYIHLIPCRFSAVDQYIEQMCRQLQSSNEFPKSTRLLIQSGKLSSSTAVTVHLATQWLTQHTHFGRLNVEVSGSAMPVLSSVVDFQRNSFHSVQFEAVRESDFVRFHSDGTIIGGAGNESESEPTKSVSSILLKDIENVPKPNSRNSPDESADKALIKSKSECCILI